MMQGHEAPEISAHDDVGGLKKFRVTFTDEGSQSSGEEALVLRENIQKVRKKSSHVALKRKRNSTELHW